MYLLVLVYTYTPACMYVQIFVDIYKHNTLVGRGKGRERKTQREKADRGTEGERGEGVEKR